MNNYHSIIETRDGSKTIYHNELGEHYHSIHGAFQESRHVFIKNGLEYFVGLSSKRPVKILEIGFGTGLNALLTLDFVARMKISTDYWGIEPFPIELNMIKQLDYDRLADLEPQIKSLFIELHHSDSKKRINMFFELTKLNCRLDDFTTIGQFDLIYFDAFSFSVNPELWSIETFLKINSLMSPSSYLVTYAAKGIIKRNMKDAGFLVESLAGPPGKREMIRAKKRIN